MLSNHPSVLGSGGGTAYNIIGGTGLFADGTAAAPSISFAADTDTGFYRVAANIIGVANNGSISMAFVAGGKIQGAGLDNELALAGNGSVSLRAGGTNQNVTLTPSGSGGVLIGGGNYFSYTPSALGLNLNATSSANCEIKLTNSTTGNSATAGMLFACNGDAGYIWNGQPSGTLNFGTANAQRAQFLANGRFLLGTVTDSANGILQLASSTTSAGGIGFGTDTFAYRKASGELAIDSTTGLTRIRLLQNTGAVGCSIYNSAGSLGIFTDTAQSVVLGTNGTIALTLDASQNATFAGSVTAGAAANFTFSGRSYISSPSDGIIRLLNNAGTDFTRLQFGGTSASFPSLKRSGNAIQVRFADDSGYTEIEPSGVRLNGVTRIISGVGSPEGATTAPPGSIFLNTSGGASTTLYVKESGAGNTGWVAK